MLFRTNLKFKLITPGYNLDLSLMCMKSARAKQGILTEESPRMVNFQISLSLKLTDF